MIKHYVCDSSAGSLEQTQHDFDERFRDIHDRLGEVRKDLNKLADEMEDAGKIDHHVELMVAQSDIARAESWMQMRRWKL